MAPASGPGGGLQVQGPGFGPVLGPGNRAPRVLGEVLGLSQTLNPPPPGPDDAGHLLKRLVREQGAHLPVARLVPADPGDRPQLRVQPRPVGEHGQVPAVVVLDLPEAPRDDGPALVVRPNPKTGRGSQRAQLGEGLGLFGGHQSSPFRPGVLGSPPGPVMSRSPPWNPSAWRQCCGTGARRGCRAGRATLGWRPRHRGCPQR